MSDDIRALQPEIMWNHFADLNAVPRPSKKEERVIAFMKKFGEDLGLETMVDEVGNVIIKKPASPGMEDRKTIVMQSHLDMVHQKNNDTDFDFDTQGIEMYIDGDWVKAKGTTLGADNGIGVASIMAVLSSNEIQHPALEALFTIDEETGMTGAMGLKGGLLDAEIMLNLDTEDDDELTIGCAGGIDVTAAGAYSTEQVEGEAMVISLKGLSGGHSGMDIHRGRGNANKLMNRVLWELYKACDVRVHAIDGGGLRNAIPRESNAMIVVPSENVSALMSKIDALSKTLKAEYQSTDPSLELTATKTTNPGTAMKRTDQEKLLRAIYSCPMGIYRMSPDIEDLVQTSNNVARVIVKDGNYSVQCLCRSSVDSEKIDEANMITACFEQIGAQVTTDGEYPGWEPRPGAAIVNTMSEIYMELFNDEPHVMACHAGLECGILGTNYPDMEMISFGPNIKGAHSPDERVQISSVQKYWSLLMETLKRIPKK